MGKDLTGGIEVRRDCLLGVDPIHRSDQPQRPPEPLDPVWLHLLGTTSCTAAHRAAVRRGDSLPLRACLRGSFTTIGAPEDDLTRCVMTTLPQSELSKDPGILNTTYRHNDNNVGVYAEVLQGGKIHLSDPVLLV